jgi:phenylpyruvate tautomerase PptA (4-oxalocrotonate tautomerase family)
MLQSARPYRRDKPFIAALSLLNPKSLSKRNTAMPLTLTITEGVLPKGTEKATFARLSDAMLKWHGLTGNKVMAPNVIGSIHVITKDHTFSGSKEARVAFIEWKVPSFAFATREIQIGYIAEVTNIVHEASGGKLPKENIWVNVVHAVDGAWGIAGRAMTNAELGEAVSKG